MKTITFQVKTILATFPFLKSKRIVYFEDVRLNVLELFGRILFIYLFYFKTVMKDWLVL